MMNNKLFANISLFIIFLVLFANISITSLGYQEFLNNTTKETQVKYDLLIITTDIFSEYFQVYS